MSGLFALWQRYGTAGLLRLAVDVLHTRLMFPQARLVRRPAYVRGRRHMLLGRGLTTGVGVRLDAFAQEGAGAVLFIGNDVQLNDYVHIAATQHVSIGEHTLIASKVFIADHNHGEYRAPDPTSAPAVPPAQRPLVSRPVHIGARVWIGEHVSVLPGVRIGDGAVIGAGSVVTNDIPPHSIAAGVPARVVRHYDEKAGKWQATPKKDSPVH